MKIVIFTLLTLIKASAIIFYVVRIVNRIKNSEGLNDPLWRALIQFFIMIGILAGLTIIEFGVGFILPSEN